MSRGRPVEALLAQVATAAALAPLTALFTPASFVVPALTLMAAVAVAGVALRAARAPLPGVLLGQLVAGLLAFGWVTGRGHLWYGLPWPETFVAWNNRLLEAIATIAHYAAPAPTNDGVTTGVTLLAGVVALAVDLVAVTRRSPAAAAIPLLTAYLTSAANSTDGLNPAYFVAAAGGWLALLSRQGTATLRRWGPTAASPSPERSADEGWLALRVGTFGRRLAMVVLAVAVVLPAWLPHLPPRYLTGGLDRTGAVGADGTVSLSDEVDVGRNLRAQSQQLVLRYRVSGAAAEPLRVQTFETFRRGRWLDTDGEALRTVGDEPAPPGVETLPARLEVEENRLRPPRLAAPSGVRSFEPDDVITRSAGGLLRTRASLGEYAVDYRVLRPTEEQVAQAEPAADPGQFGEYLATDEGSRGAVDSVLSQIVPEGASRLETARAIQAYLRGSAFTYSLELAPAVPQPDGGRDPVTQFLLTRQGYCVQFATTMVMMARARGIPARFVTGFLPGRVDDTGAREVVAANAHAWPELWFPGTGWLRFEPTPGVQAGTAPSWSIDAARPTSTATATVTTGTGGPAPTSSGPRTVDNPLDGTGAPVEAPFTTRLLTAVRDLSPAAWFALALVVGLLGSLALPLLGAADRRRRLRRAGDDATRTEAQWQALLARVDDLGVSAPRGSTPRQSAEDLSRRVVLPREDVARLHHVVDSLEVARYARPGTAIVDVAEDARQVGVAVSRALPWQVRLRALLLPSDGLRAARRARAAARAAPRRLLARVRAGFTRRH